MSSALDALCGPGGPLKQEPPDAAEYLGLIDSGEARLADSMRPANSLVSRFDLAYNADRAHNVRNRSEYEGDLSVDERLLASVIDACGQVSAALRALPPL